jgi:hypothetical protein
LSGSGADADPLGVRVLERGYLMAVLLIILVTTVGLAARVGMNGRLWNIAGSDASGVPWLADTYARSFIVVLLSLLGLLALGTRYGNVSLP